MFAIFNFFDNTAALGIPFQPLPDYEEGAELVSFHCY